MNAARTRTTIWVVAFCGLHGCGGSRAEPLAGPSGSGPVPSVASSGGQSDAGSGVVVVRSSAGPDGGEAPRTTSGESSSATGRKESARGDGTVPGGLARGSGTSGDRALLEADRAYARGDLSRAREHYAAAEKLLPGDPAPRVGLLRVKIAISGVPTDFGGSAGDPRVFAWQKEADHLLRKHPDYGPLLVERGRLLLMEGKGEAALAVLTRAASLLPVDPEAQSSLGVALLATGKTTRALEQLQKAVQLEPDEPERLTNLGTALMMVGRVQEALMAYRRAAALAPNDALAEGNLGTAYLAAGLFSEAKPHLLRAVAMSPDRATFLSNLGYAEHKLGELEAARKTLDLALTKDPKLVSAWLNKGALLVDLGKLDEAERALKKAAELDPSDPRPKASLSDLAEVRRRAQ